MIRHVTATDAAVVADLAYSMHQESKYCHIPFNRAKVVRLVEHHLHHPTMCGIVSTVRDNQIVGFLAAAEAEYFFGDGKVVSDLAVYVHPEHRGGLHLFKMINALQEWARKRDVHSIVLGTSATADDGTLAAAYQRFGYDTWGGIYRKELV